MAFIVDKETYKVLNYMTNFACNVQNGWNDDNMPIIGYNFSGGANNERWIADREDGDYFSFTTRSSVGIRKVLDASGTAPGKVVIYPYSGQDQQLWTTEPVNDNNFLCFIKSKKTGNYLQFNGASQELSLVPKAKDNKNQWWSIQELDSRVCADAGWLATLTPKKSEEARKERERIERERIERERIETERIERERIEHEKLEREKLDREGQIERERNERERIERERIERERLERERLEREKLQKEREEKEKLEPERREAELHDKERLIEEKERRIQELEEAQNQKDLQNKDFAKRERKIAEREKRIIMMDLERREKAVQEREKWLRERARLQSDLNIIIIRLRGRLSDSERKANEAEKEQLEKKLLEHDRIEKEALMKEKVIKEQQEKLDREELKKEQELNDLERTDMAQALREREAWLIFLESEYERMGRITIRYVFTERHVTDTVPQSHTTHTRTVEETGGERVTRDLEVTETERVIKTVEYR